MLENIFNKPTVIDDIYLYPIIMKDYDEFIKCNTLLYLNYQHFIFKKDETNDYKLLDLVLYCSGDAQENINNLTKLLELVTKEKINYVCTKYYYAFLIGEEETDLKAIDNNNYDKIREIIMKQNLMIEPKIFKNKTTQKWADKVLKAKSKNAPKIGIEEMLSTVSALAHKDYERLENYSIYQLYSDFYRLVKDRDINAKLQGAEVKTEHFAEYLDLYHNPYDDIFVDKSKLKNINNALKSE